MMQMVSNEPSLYTLNQKFILVLSATLRAARCKVTRCLVFLFLIVSCVSNMVKWGAGGERGSLVALNDGGQQQGAAGHDALDLERECAARLRHHTHAQGRIE